MAMGRYGFVRTQLRTPGLDVNPAYVATPCVTLSKPHPISSLSFLLPKHDEYVCLTGWSRKSHEITLSKMRRGGEAS